MEFLELSIARKKDAMYTTSNVDLSATQDSGYWHETRFPYNR